MTNEQPITALVLPGKRDGKLDLLAQRFEVTHKCVVPIAGKPLIEHVLTALAQAPEIARIIVAIDGAEVLDGIAIVSQLRAEGRLRFAAAQANIAASVAEAAKDAAFPLLVTTADNVLLTPAAVTAMARGVAASGAEVAAGFARRAEVIAAHPDGQRRFYEFADDAYANCNCYWIGSARALEAAEIFREGGQFNKHPWRIARAFGLINLIRFRLGLGSLERALQRFSRRLGLAVRPVVFDDGALAIDVDNARTYAVAAELLARRRLDKPIGEVIALPLEEAAAQAA